MKWHDIKECKPFESGMYWVTVELGNGSREARKTFWYASKEHFDTSLRVIAWSKIEKNPKPYKW